MKLNEAMEYCERIIYDIKMMRPDTYLKPMMEQLKDAVNTMQFNNIMTPQQIQRKLTKKQHAHVIRFPQNWK